MALERVPSDIRKEGVARMARSKYPRNHGHRDHSVMAKVRIGHSRKRKCFRRWKWIFIDESEVLTPATKRSHLEHDYRVPFVCGARNLGEALRRIAEGAAMIRTKAKRARETW